MLDGTTAVSVDLDDLGCYYAVHGLGAQAPSRALTHWLPRFLELFDSLGVRATFFVIGHDLERELEEEGRGAQALRDAVAAGHELASHSYAHAYDMSRWPQARVAEDLRRCDDLLRTLGTTPRGFRAPGYTHGIDMLRAAEEVGYCYDSSALPSPAYYLGKLAVMASMAARGKQSSSLASGGSSFFGPRLPYARTDVDLVELPMSVTPWARLPIIGTTVLSSPDALRRRIIQTARALPHLHLELHAIDLADPRHDGIDVELPELRVPLATRQARLEALLGARVGFSTLAQLASRIASISSG